MPRAELMALCEGCTKVFVDINGTRVLDHVAQIVRVVQRVLQPQLILLKSRQMHKLARDEGEAFKLVHEIQLKIVPIISNGLLLDELAGVCGQNGVLTADARWDELLEELAQGKQPRRQQHARYTNATTRANPNAGPSKKDADALSDAGQSVLPRLSRRERRARAKAAKRQKDQRGRCLQVEKQ